MATQVKLRQVDEYRWEIPREGKMRTRGLIFASQKMIAKIQEDQSLQQVANVATLPGIVGASLAMPDIHWGYGFPIGGVAAFDLDEGVVSPGGVGYDINCGVRLLRTNLQRPEVQPPHRGTGQRPVQQHPLGAGLPAQGLEAHGPHLARSDALGAALGGEKRFRRARRTWSTSRPRGRFAGADPELVSDFAMDRGKDQLGTLGSGNHFVEVGYVEEVFDDSASRALGLH